MIKRSKPGKKIHKSKGKTTGLGICSYIAILFDVNESSPRKKKMTDSDIAKKILEEFPSRKSAKSFLDHSVRYLTINSYRGFYNSGALTGTIPKVRSFRYGKLGLPVEGRKGNRILFPDEIEVLIAKHKELYGG